MSERLTKKQVQMMREYEREVERQMETETKYRFDVQGVGENVWSSNGKEYDTPAEANAAARELGSRWMGIESYRVVTVDTPRNETVKSEERKTF